MSLVLSAAFLGDSGVGKTHLIQAFISGGPPESYNPSVVTSYKCRISVDGQVVALTVKDTAGSQESAVFGEVAMIFFALDNPESLQHVGSKWVPLWNRYCPDSPWILIGTRADMRVHALVSVAEAADCARKYGARAYVETSTVTSEGVRIAISEAVHAGLQFFPEGSPGSNSDPPPPNSSEGEKPSALSNSSDLPMEKKQDETTENSEADRKAPPVQERDFVVEENEEEKEVEDHVEEASLYHKAVVRHLSMPLNRPRKATWIGPCEDVPGVLAQNFQAAAMQAPGGSQIHSMFGVYVWKGISARDTLSREWEGEPSFRGLQLVHKSQGKVTLILSDQSSNKTVKKCSIGREDVLTVQDSTRHFIIRCDPTIALGFCTREEAGAFNVEFFRKLSGPGTVDRRSQLQRSQQLSPEKKQKGSLEISSPSDFRKLDQEQVVRPELERQKRLRGLIQSTGQQDSEKQDDLVATQQQQQSQVVSQTVGDQIASSARLQPGQQKERPNPPPKPAHVSSRLDLSGKQVPTGSEITDEEKIRRRRLLTNFIATRPPESSLRNSGILKSPEPPPKPQKPLATSASGATSSPSDSGRTAITESGTGRFKFGAKDKKEKEKEREEKRRDKELERVRKEKEKEREKERRDKLDREKRERKEREKEEKERGKEEKKRAREERKKSRSLKDVKNVFVESEGLRAQRAAVAAAVATGKMSQKEYDAAKRLLLLQEEEEARKQGKYEQLMASRDIESVRESSVLENILPKDIEATPPVSVECHDEKEAPCENKQSDLAQPKDEEPKLASPELKASNVNKDEESSDDKPPSLEASESPEPVVDKRMVRVEETTGKRRGSKLAVLAESLYIDQERERAEEEAEKLEMQRKELAAEEHRLQEQRRRIEEMKSKLQMKKEAHTLRRPANFIEKHHAEEAEALSRAAREAEEERQRLAEEKRKAEEERQRMEEEMRMMEDELEMMEEEEDEDIGPPSDDGTE